LACILRHILVNDFLEVLNVPLNVNADPCACTFRNLFIVHTFSQLQPRIIDFTR